MRDRRDGGLHAHGRECLKACGRRMRRLRRDVNRVRDDRKRCRNALLRLHARWRGHPKDGVRWSGRDRRVPLRRGCGHRPKNGWRTGGCGRMNRRDSHLNGVRRSLRIRWDGSATCCLWTDGCEIRWDCRMTDGYGKRWGCPKDGSCCWSCRKNGGSATLSCRLDGLTSCLDG